MESNTRLALVGAFVVGGILLFAVGLFMIGNRRMLFNDTFDVYAEFSNIASLENGATVRVEGMGAGEVTEIKVPAGPSGRFRLKMRVRSDLRPVIRVDSVASIQNDGLVGNKFVQIDSGSEAAAVVPDQGTIQSREPFDLADLLQKMSDTIDTANKTIEDVKGQLNQALIAVSDTAGTAQDLMQDVGKEARAIMAASQRVSSDLQTIVSGVRQGKGTVGRLMNDDALYVSAKNVAADAEKAVANLREASEQAKAAVADFRGDGGPMKGMTGQLQQTLAVAKDAMSDLAENTEALKHNFLFRGFFSRRGYFDLDDVSVQEYRQGALASRDRRVLRVWIRRELLFELDANGQERLSDGGRARLDSAMSGFVKYPKGSPLVIEGYGAGITEEQRFLLSRTRARVARDYLVGKFGLDPNFVATMPMGIQADGSPDGETWEGVALALFVTRS